MMSSISAETVYENDLEFEFQYGTHQNLVHKPELDVDKRGAPYAFWAEVWVKGADRSEFKVMGIGEMREWPNQYVRNKKGPWFEAESTSAFKWMAKANDMRSIVITI